MQSSMLKFLNHPCWPYTTFTRFPTCWDGSILTLADTIPESQPALLDLCLQNHHSILPGRSLKRPKSASLKPRVIIHLFVLLPPSESWMPTSHGSWSLQPKHLFFFFFWFSSTRFNRVLTLNYSITCARSCHQYTPETSWIAFALLYYPSSRYQGKVPQKDQTVNMRLFLIVWRRP